MWKLKKKVIKDYVKEVQQNPHVFCFNECYETERPKHKDNVVPDNQYLYALMKGTVYCPFEDYEI